MKERNKQDSFMIMDTGAASGRLGLIALATARYLAETNDMNKTVVFARKAVSACEEYIFLDKLQYLAEGGRLSKTGALFGDMLKMKPVISPQPEGAKKVGTVKTQEDQVTFAITKLDTSLKEDSNAMIMLEYSDNKKWVHGTVKKSWKSYIRRRKLSCSPCR